MFYRSAVRSLRCNMTGHYLPMASELKAIRAQQRPLGGEDDGGTATTASSSSQGGFSLDVTSRHVTSRHVTSRHVTSRPKVVSLDVT